MKRFLYSFLLWMAVASCTNKAAEDKGEITGKVVSVADGDTFTMLTEGNRQVKVRLHGIDCPERAQDFGQRAKQRLSDLIFSKTVSVQEQTVDRYRRIVGIVYRDKACINEEMLREGLAWHYTRYDHNAEWARIEKEASRAKRGLWIQPNPVPPWEWRRK